MLPIYSIDYDGISEYMIKNMTIFYYENSKTSNSQ